MANPRPLVIAIAFGLIAVVLVYLYVRQVEKKAASSEVEMITVVRATENIPPRTTVRESMVEEISMPANVVPPDAVVEMEEIIGKVSLTAIYEQQMLMRQMFEEETQLQDLSRMLKEGELAVTIGVTEVSGLGGNLKPGDNVDVMVTILDNPEVGVPSTFTILRRVGVMAVGQDIGFSDDAEPLTDKASISKSVTLKVNTKQAEILALASEVGSIRLALRHPDDYFAPSSSGTALTEFTAYVPTREDLQKSREREREAAERASDTRARDSYARPQPAVSDSGVSDSKLGVSQLQQPGPPPYIVELILGGQSQIIQLQR